MDAAPIRWTREHSRRPRSRCASLLRIALLATGLPAGALAQGLSHEQSRIVASDRAAFDYFGWSLDADAEWIAVGALGSGDGGAAYLYRRGLALQQTRIPAPHVDCESFGRRVALGGGRLYVADPNFDDDRGRVDEYRFDGADWIHYDHLEGAAPDDWFGLGLDYDPATETLVVGSPVDDGEGRVCVYVSNGGPLALQAVLEDAYGVTNDAYGHTVSLDGDRLAVGIPYRLSRRGQVLCYQRSGSEWSDAGRLTHPDTGTNSRFGTSLHLRDDQLAVGSPGPGPGYDSPGRADLYHWDGASWGQPLAFHHPDGAAFDRLGSAVRLHGDVLSVGAEYDDDPVEAQGSVYQWRRRGEQWLPLQRAMGQEPDVNATHGHALAAHGDLLFVGAPGTDHGPDGFVGAVFVHHVPDFSLRIEPDAGSPGIDLAVRHTAGDPGQPVALFVMALDDAPFVRRLALGFLGAAGDWSLMGRYEHPGLSGLDVELQSFSLNSGSQLEASNRLRFPLH